MKMKMMFIFITVLALFGAAPARAEQGTLFTSAQILKEYFEDADTVEKVSVELSPLADQLKARLGYMPRGPFDVWIGKKGGAVTGYAVIDDEKGMHEPITFSV